MPYDAITSMRIPYDIDGTVMYINTGGSTATAIDVATATIANSTTLIALNDENIGTNYSQNIPFNAPAVCLTLFFPEAMVIDKCFVSASNSSVPLDVNSIKGSDDTTNGNDGIWESPSLPNGLPIGSYILTSDWRSQLKTISFTKPMRAVRIMISTSNGTSNQQTTYINSVHLYGKKAVGETPDDLVFCETNGTEMTALNDFGDRPEATTETDSFKIKNVSTTKTATTVNVAVTHTDFLLSLSETGPWTASVDIASLAPAALTDIIYIKNELGQPPLVLGPKAAKVVATVGTWV